VLRGRPAWLWPKPAHALNPPPPLSLPHADGEAPPVSFVSSAHGGSATAPAAVSEVLGPRARAHQPRLAFATPLTSPTHALLSPFHLGLTNGGRPPQPTADRPLGLGRAQTDVLESFHEGE